MGNMVDYKQEATGVDPKIRLHVEGKTDRKVIQDRWLKHDRQLRGAFDVVASREEQNGAKSDPAGGGGSPQVVQRLQEDLAEPTVIAMGLVDRDYLLNVDIDLFLEEDEDRFFEGVSTAVGAELSGRLWVLPRWEIENYLLLDTDLVGEVCEDNLRSSSTPSPIAWDSAEDVAHLLMEEAAVGKPWAAYQVVQKRNKRPFRKVKDHDGLKSAQAMRSALQAVDEELSSEELRDVEARIDCFDTLPGGSNQARWQRLSRVVDGKWLLRRVFLSWTKLSLDHVPLNLASRCARKEEGCPEEVKKLFRKMRTSARQLSRAA